MISMPPLADVGFIAGQLLIAVAALAADDPVAPPQWPRRPPDGLTCCCTSCRRRPVATVIAGDGGRAFTSESLDGSIVLVLVLVQAMTLLENAGCSSACPSARPADPPGDPRAHGARQPVLFGDRRCRLHPPLQPLVVRPAVIDLDDFKAVNDNTATPPVTIAVLVGERLLFVQGGDACPPGR